MLARPQEVFEVDRNGHQQGAQLGDRHGDPGACDSQESRQDQQCRRGEQQRSAKRDDRGGLSVRQSCEKARGCDIQPAEQEVDSEELEACHSQGIGLRILGEYRRDRAGQKEGQERHKQGSACCEQEGNLVQPAQLMPVLRAVLEPYDRADADGKSQVKSVEQKFSVEQDGDGGNAVFAGQAQENDIK